MQSQGTIIPPHGNGVEFDEQSIGSKPEVTWTLAADKTLGAQFALSRESGALNRNLLVGAFRPSGNGISDAGSQEVIAVAVPRPSPGARQKRHSAADVQKPAAGRFRRVVISFLSASS